MRDPPPPAGRTPSILSGNPKRLVSRESFSFRVLEQQTSARRYDAPGTPTATLVLGHGAGAPQSHPWMVAMAKAVAARGITVVTFNFPYTEARRRAPDRPDVLEATWRAA